MPENVFNVYRRIDAPAGEYVLSLEVPRIDESGWFVSPISPDHRYAGRVVFVEPGWPDDKPQA